MKEFITLTVRGLDAPDKQEIVKVMNQIAERFDLKTGQAIVEKAVLEYRYLNDRIIRMNESFNKTSIEKDKQIEELSLELGKYKAFFDNYNTLQSSFMAIAEPVGSIVKSYKPYGKKKEVF